MTESETKAREAGWFPTCEAHVMFQSSTGVCRHLRKGETYTDNLDSYMSVPLRHARNWEQALLIDSGDRAAIAREMGEDEEDEDDEDGI